MQVIFHNYPAFDRGAFESIYNYVFDRLPVAGVLDIAIPRQEGEVYPELEVFTLPDDEVDQLKQTITKVAVGTLTLPSALITPTDLIAFSRQQKESNNGRENNEDHR